MKISVTVGWFFLGIVAVLGAVLPLATAAEPAKRPNIVFILADDMGWGDPHCFGHPYMLTPALDKLAGQGTSFTQFYVDSPVCSSSRTALVTGHYPARYAIHGHFASHAENAARGMPDWLDPKVPTVMRLLHDAGYATAHYGKWHLGGGPGAPVPVDYGVDDSKTINSSGPTWPTAGTDPFFRAKSTELVVDETLRFIRANKDKPFYVNVWTPLPHGPLNPTPEQLSWYKDLVPHPEDFVGPFVKYVRTAPNPASQMQVYCASVTAFDVGITRLLKGLDEMGLSDNTLVFFTSDNGPEDYHLKYVANSGMGCPGAFNGRKRSLYDGGVRVPCIARWPGHIAAGKVDKDSLLTAVDFLPTVCKIAGVPLPADYNGDGEDVSDILTGASRPRTKPILWEWRFIVVGDQSYFPPGLAIRRDNWKLFVDPDGTHTELFDIPHDASEQNDLAAQHADLVQRMSQEVLAWAKTLPPGPRGNIHVKPER